MMDGLDMGAFVAPKSDQLNADDLIAGPRTIRITKVSGTGNSDQPVAVHFEGDDGKPYKPCKSMRRVMVNCWGSDGNAFVGRSMTLYRDERVVFGGIQVGGIRISHMSDIDRDVTMALTASKAKRTPYTVKVLQVQQRPAGTKTGADLAAEQQAAKPPLAERITAWRTNCERAGTTAKLADLWARSSELRNDIEAADPDEHGTVKDLESWWQGLFDAAEAKEREAQS